MSDQPFGFSSGDDPDRGRGGGGQGGGGGFGGGFGFGPGGAGGFDPSQLGQMFTQLGQMLSSAGTSSGPVNYDLAKQLATQQLGTVTPVRDAQRGAVADAVRLAELWLDDVTTLPAGATTTAAWTPADWLEHSMPTWKRLCDPVATKVAGAWVDGLPEEARQLAGPMIGMMGQMGGLAFGSQLGQALGQLAGEVLSSTDVGLPLGPAGTAALLPAAVEALATGLDRPQQEVVVYVAAREAAYQRLFAHVPWLRQRLLATVEEYASGITVDFSAIEELAKGLDPAMLQDPSALEGILSRGTFEPTTTPAQKVALERLETLLALVEGWVDAVVTDAVGSRLPGAEGLRETLRRRRASGGPAEQTFATLVGLELRPRRLREAAELWRLLAARGDADARDAVWSHPDLLPVAADLDDPAAFVERYLVERSGVAGDDPIAELERQMAAERDEDASPGTSDGPAAPDTDDEGPDDGPAPTR
ncbi:zinc-dependent metalloprotease [Rhodococcus aerolatus]